MQRGVLLRCFTRKQNVFPPFKQFKCLLLPQNTFLHETRCLNMSKQGQNQIKVLYDGMCPICVTEINLMKRLDKNEKSVKFVDITEGIYNQEDHQGITYKEAMGKMHVIDKDGKVHDSMDAMKMMYSAVGLDWLSKLLTLPVIKPASDSFYIWFAKNRYWLTGRNKEDCETGRCKIPEKK